MGMSLYDATIGTFIQTLGAVEGFLARGFEHCRDHQIDPADIVETRLYHDMLPLRFQVVSTITHSVGAIECVKRGVFAPAPATPSLDYSGLQRSVVEARGQLAKLTRDEVDRLEGGDLKFEFGERSFPFTAENFLLSYSLPNFYFHSSMAYGILRARGVPLGKRDFMGQLRLKP